MTLDRALPARPDTGMKYADSVLDLIGNTPLVKLNQVTDGMPATVLAKVEYFNPGGSSKDRIAASIIDAAEREGKLKPGGTIVEPTSGNTGVGLALVAQQRGYRCIFVVPDKVGEDKRNVLTRLRRRGRRHADRRRARQPRVVLQRLRPARRARSPARSSPTSTRTRTARAATTRRPAPRSGATPTAGSRTSSPASAPAARSPAPAATCARCRAARVRIIGADPEGSVYSGGTGRPYLVEGVGEDFWPSAYDPTRASTRSSRSPTPSRSR